MYTVIVDSLSTCHFVLASHMKATVMLVPQSSVLQNTVNVVFPDHLIEVHGKIVVVQTLGDNVVAVLQQNGHAHNHQEWIASTEL